jgi:hypothetical protein
LAVTADYAREALCIQRRMRTLRDRLIRIDEPLARVNRTPSHPGRLRKMTDR